MDLIESEDSSGKALDILESRIIQLEMLIGLEKGSSDSTICNIIDLFDDKVLELETSQDNIFQKAMQDYQEVRGIIGSNLSLKSQLIESKPKGVILAENELLLSSITKDFQKLKELENYLNFDPLYEMDEKIVKLQAIQGEHLDQIIKASKQSEDLQNTLTEYNQIISELNEKFAYYHLVISQLEEKNK